MGRVFNFRRGYMPTMHLLPSVAEWPNLELKTQPKQLLGSRPLVIALPVGRQWQNESLLHLQAFFCAADFATNVNEPLLLKLKKSQENWIFLEWNND